jgi:archaellum component FlaG (FlaF/FlaG flagellin family)
MQIYQKKNKETIDILIKYTQILKEYDDILKTYRQFIKSIGYEPPIRTNTSINTTCSINQKYISYIEKYGVPEDGCFNEQLLLLC